MDFWLPFTIPENCTLIFVLPSKTNLSRNYETNLKAIHRNFTSVTLVNFDSLENNVTYSKVESSPTCFIVLLMLSAIQQIINSTLYLNSHLTQNTLYFTFPMQKENYDFKLFQSERFQMAHPKLTFLWNEAELTLICYLCPQPNITIVKNSELIVWSSFIAYVKSLNSQGFGKPAVVSSVGDNNTEFIRSLEKAMKTDWQIGYTVKVLLGILSLKLNFTVFITENIANFNPQPRLHICNHCDPELNIHRQSRFGLAVMHVNQEAYFYCTTSVRLASGTPWSFLLNPFDTWIWLSILGSTLLFCAIFRSPWHSLNILWGILGIPFTRLWDKYKVLVIISYPLLVLQYYYVGFFTSDVILPYDPEQVQTNYDLFVKMGFRNVRTVCDKEADWKVYVERHAKVFARHKIDPSPENFLLIINDCQGDGFMKSAKFVGKGASIIQTKFTKQTVVKVHKVFPQYYCNVVKEAWDVAVVSTNYDSHMSQRYGEILSYLQAAGIDVYYEGVYMAGARREAMSGNTAFKGGDATGHLFSLFKLCAILFVIGLFSFAVEFFIGIRKRKRCGLK